ncbi:MAG: LytTR family DNA-binding domain-containing protein [Flavobacteriales bacterium]|nr:LytTR family DNA-binding domain-containing protein [Flavobacteriales bacterium]
MTLSTIIVDDEPLALDLLQRYVERTPFLSLKARCSGSSEAIEALSYGDIDVAFLDIQMPGMNGLELSRLIGERTQVVFTTAFDRYALDGFKVGAADYLLKPFDYTEFLRAASKVLRWYTMTQPLSKDKTDEREDKNIPEYIMVKSDYKQVRIALSNILYIEGVKDYIKIHLKDSQKPIMTLSSLKAMEDTLPGDTFVRIHRSFIVNISAVEVIERSRIVFGKEYVPISESYRENFDRILGKKTIGG